MKSSEDLFTTRSIRALLLKGANPAIRDSVNLLPSDFLGEFDLSQNLMVDFVQEIYELLRTETPQGCFSIGLKFVKDCECFAIN